MFGFGGKSGQESGKESTGYARLDTIISGYESSSDHLGSTEEHQVNLIKQLVAKFPDGAAAFDRILDPALSFDQVCEIVEEFNDNRNQGFEAEGTYNQIDEYIPGEPGQTKHKVGVKFFDNGRVTLGCGR